jgi:hypothetical protein
MRVAQAAIPTPISADIVEVLIRFGLEPAEVSMCRSEDGITFAFREPAAAMQTLGKKSMFAQVPLGSLHREQVGKVATEYRSYRGSAGYSLHVVIGKNGSVFAHLDRFNPYEGPVAFILHGSMELVPHLLGRLLRRCRLVLG